MGMKGKSVPLSLLVLWAMAWGPGAVPVSSDSGSGTFRYLAATDFLCGLAPSACPDVARADNGDTIEITGSGTLSIHPKSVSGGGTFTHKDANGNVLGSGTWTAEQLISFNPFVVLPNNLAGGLAVIRVHVSAGFDAILQIDCGIGAPPAHEEDGVRLAVQDVINFNQKVSGLSVFIKQ